MRLVHAAVTGSQIDGYPVTNPVGFKGRHVKLSVFNAFAPLIHLGALQSVAGAAGAASSSRSWPSRTRWPESSPASKSSSPAPSSSTSAAERRTSPWSGTAASRGRECSPWAAGRSPSPIADRLDLPFPRAEEIKLDYARGVAVDRRSEVATIIADDVAIWAAGVELVLDELASGDLLPGRIYLCGGGSHLPEIEATLRSEAFWRHLPFSRPPEVFVITPKQVERIKDGTNLLVDQQDVTPLGLAYQAIELQTNEDPLDIALRRVLRAMKM